MTGAFLATSNKLPCVNVRKKWTFFSPLPVHVTWCQMCDFCCCDQSQFNRQRLTVFLWGVMKADRWKLTAIFLADIKDSRNSGGFQRETSTFRQNKETRLGESVNLALRQRIAYRMNTKRPCIQNTWTLPLFLSSNIRVEGFGLAVLTRCIRCET